MFFKLGEFDFVLPGENNQVSRRYRLIYLHIAIWVQLLLGNSSARLEFLSNPLHSQIDIQECKDIGAQEVMNDKLDVDQCSYFS